VFIGQLPSPLSLFGPLIPTLLPNCFVITGEQFELDPYFISKRLQLRSCRILGHKSDSFNATGTGNLFEGQCFFRFTFAFLLILIRDAQS